MSCLEVCLCFNFWRTPILPKICSYALLLKVKEGKSFQVLMWSVCCRISYFRLVVNMKIWQKTKFSTFLCFWSFQDYQMYLVKLWLNSIVPNARTSTPLSHLAITTLMGLTLAQVSLICSLWCIQNTVPNAHQTSLYQGEKKIVAISLDGDGGGELKLYMGVKLLSLHFLKGRTCRGIRQWNLLNSCIVVTLSCWELCSMMQELDHRWSDAKDTYHTEIT